MQFGQEALDRVHVMIIIVALSEFYNFAQTTIVVRDVSALDHSPPGVEWHV